jgi:hypothetical protein
MKTPTDKVQRYEAALRRIIYQAESWKRLMEHWEETGRGVTDTHRAILRAYLGNAREAAAALGMSRRQLLRRVGAKA